MAQLSDYAENALINHLLRNVALTSPATIYVALHSADPTDDASGAELSGDGYNRVAVSFDAPSDGEVQNSSELTFGPATADWLAATHISLWDASSGGNMLFHGELDAPQTALSGNELVISAAALTASLA